MPPSIPGHDVSVTIQHESLPWVVKSSGSHPSGKSKGAAECLLHELATRPLVTAKYPVATVKKGPLRGSGLFSFRGEHTENL